MLKKKIVKNKPIRMIALGILIFISLILAAGSILSLIAMSTLPADPRTGLRSKTIEEAVVELKTKEIDGWELVNAATNMVDDRMQYCRRNNLQHYRRAFSRGLGFSIPLRVFSSWGSSMLNTVVYFRTGSEKIRF